MYQSEYPASSINILSSDTFEPNVVSKSPTMAELIPIYNAFFTASTLICERPPAKRRKAVGLIKRNKAMVIDEHGEVRIPVRSPKSGDK